MALIRIAELFEGKKRRTAYRSGRRELIGFELPTSGVKKPNRRSPRDKSGRLIARTPFASKTRWREW